MYDVKLDKKLSYPFREIVVQCRPCAILTPAPFYAIWGRHGQIADDKDKPFIREREENRSLQLQGNARGGRDHSKENEAMDH